MIEKSRLEELIKQGAIIYTLKKGEVYELPFEPGLYEKISVDEKFLYIKDYCSFTDIIPFEGLYETRKRAEWASKYQRIPHTEWLDLPMWEEFCKNNKTICFMAKDWQCYELGFAFGDAENICLDKVVLGVNTNQKTWKATEENYIKACALCVKLFKGENDENRNQI